ncbi:MAG: type VI secretion system-associated protein TagF [Erythrobacter sp.]|nr:type VI secretion system-associated protein TagF [Erythrobacter sp.]
MVGTVSADAVNRSTIEPPAIIGKLPGHGDFLARGVDYALRERLDRWMSEWIELSRREMGPEFESGYASAAPWLMEGRTVSAVLMPSIDSVGRLFPVLALCASRVATQEIYDTLVSAVEQGFKIDVLHERLGNLEGNTMVSGGSGKGGWFLPEGAEPVLPDPSDAPAWAAIREHFA